MNPGLFTKILIALILLLTKNISAQNPILLSDSLTNPGQVFKLSNGYNVFSASDNVHGSEPRVTDGTVTGTTLLKDIKPGSATSFQESLHYPWAISLDIGGDYSGSVSGVMNTLGNLGGALSSVVIGYLATKMGWNWPFLVGSAMCLVAALLATRINPNRSAVECRA